MRDTLAATSSLAGLHLLLDYAGDAGRSGFLRIGRGLFRWFVGGADPFDRPAWVKKYSCVTGARNETPFRAQ